MSTRVEGIDLVSAMAAAAAGVSATLRKDPISVVLIWGDRPYAEIVQSDDVPRDVCQTLTASSGCYVADLVRRSGEPLRITWDTLPDEAKELRTALRQNNLAALAVFPLFGESGVVGCLAVPYWEGETLPDRQHQSWRLACSTLVGVQLIAATAALRASLAQDRRRPAELFDGVLTLDRSGRIVFADGLFRALPGWDGADPFGRELDRLPGAQVFAGLSESAPRELVWQDEVLPSSDGSTIPVALSSIRLGSDDGAMAGGRILFLRDLRADGQSGLDGTGRMLALGMRVGHTAEEVSHALRLARATQGLAGGSDWMIEYVSHEVEEARRLVADCLEGCLPEEDRQTVQLNSLMDEVLGRYEAELSLERIKLFSFMRGGLPLIPGDRLALARAIHILVQQSRESLRPSGGTLTARTWADDAWVYAAISDDGAGRETDHGKLGEPLFKTVDDSPQTGIEVVREIVERRGGRVLVESRPGVWTRVTLMLRQERRRARRSPTEGSGADTGAAGERRGLRVLVVDDNAALRSVLRRYLERRGHAVTEAIDGEEGLRLVQGHDFDRLIVDLQMPGKDGPEFYHDLHGLDPSMQARTIFMTGGFLSDAFERFIHETGRPSVKKPFDLAEMARTVEARG